MPGPDPDGPSSTSSDSKWKRGLKAAGKSLSSSGSDLMDRAASERISPVQYRKGGKIRKKKSRVKSRA